MLAKYRLIKSHVYEYICNRIQAEIKPEVIVREVSARFPSEIAFCSCSQEMIDEFLLWMCGLAYYIINGSVYEDSFPPSRDSAPALQDDHQT